MMDDPFHWTLDRVVQEFCTSKRSWKPIVNPPRLPDSTQLEESLRENEVEGWVLLSSDPRDLCSMLCVRSAGQVITIIKAVEQLRKRSQGYERSLRDQTPDEEQGNLDYQVVPAQAQIETRNPGPTETELQESKDRLRKFLLGGSTAPVAAKTNGIATHSPEHPSAPGASSQHDLEDEDNAPLPESSKPPPKKRRLALNSLETKPLEPNIQRTSRPIPTAADNVPSLQSLVGATLHVPAGSYLPPQSISRIDFLDRSFTPQGLETQETENGFTFTRQTTIPRGRQIQAHRIHKRLFSGRFNLASSLRGVSDMIVGASDPEHDKILPVLGESDEEDWLDEQTWKEIEKERLERENGAKLKAQAAALFLSPEEVATTLDDLTQRVIQNWQERKLISLQKSAYKRWRESRGDLHSHIRKVERVLNGLEARLSKYRENILGQQWKSRRSVHDMSPSLEATISDVETCRWELQLLRSPITPEKTPSLPQPRKPKPSRPLQPLGADEEEILTSEDEDGLDNFIVHDDEAQMSSMVEPGDLGNMSDDDVPMDIDSEHDQNEDESANCPDSAVGEATSDQDTSEAQYLQNPMGNNEPNASETAQFNLTGDAPTAGVESTAEVDISLVTDAPAPPQAPLPLSQFLRTPSKGRFCNGEVIDLTQSPVEKSFTTPTTSQARITAPANRTPSRSATKIQPKIKEEPAPSSSARSIPSSTPAQVGSKESSLEFDTDEPGSIRQKIAHIIDSERDEIIDFIFTVVKFSGQNLWDDFVRPLFITFDYPKDPKRLDIKVSYRLVSMLQIWDGQEPMSPLRFKRAKRITREELLARVKAESPGDFANFLSGSLSDRFVWKESYAAKALIEPVQETDGNTCSDVDAEYGVSEEEGRSSQNTPRKKKRLTTLDKQARELRRDDVARTVEQQARRQALRAKLQAYGDVSDAQFIINESKDDDDGFIIVHQDIAKRIKTHQVDGVRFMWNLIVPSRGTRQGCLLAHSMGLGKTMQIITLLVAITDAANSSDETIRRQIPDELQETRFLILCPPALINNWHDEFLCWVPDDHNLGRLYQVDSELEVGERLSRIQSWSRDGGVLLLSYSLFRTLFNDQKLQIILKERPNLVVADEAHMFKNPKSKLHLAAAEFLTQSRIAMTGSPLANNVEEYHSMINWIAPNYLSDLKAFRSHFARPIHDGLQITSSSYERRKAMQRLHFLKKEVAPKVDRKTIAVLRNSIPKKTEFVLVMPLTKIQWDAYQLMISHQRGLVFDSERNASTTVFATLGVLGLLCAHPVCFKHRLGKQGKLGGTQKKLAAVESVEPAEPEEDMTEEQACANLDPQLVAQQQFLVRDVEKMREDVEPLAWKVKIFMAIVEECQKCGDSVLVFSQSLGTLDYLGKKLTFAKIPHERLDGSTKMGERQGMIKKFNDSTTGRVFLISTTAGGLGLNITGANRVIIFDFKFNPQHEQQAIGRAYRIGQTKPVYVYRLICGGTFEEMLLDRIVFKMQLAERVVDKKNPIPKAQQFAEFLKMPTDPPQKDLTKYKGQDNVLDAVLKSDTHRGLRSILTMDTFEEEELDTYEATEAEQAEMEALMRPGMSFVPSRVEIPMQYPKEPPLSQAAVSSSLLAGVTTELNGHLGQAPTDVPLAPIAGASTSIRKPDSADYRPSQLRSNRTEFKRLFLKTEPASRPLSEDERNHRSKTAYDLALLLSEKEIQLSKSLRDAILKAADSPSFGQAVSDGILPPERLVNMEPSAIEQWQISIAAPSQQQLVPQPLIAQKDPEHLHSGLQRMSSISNGHATALKPHYLGDRAAMEAVFARRADRTLQQSNGPAFVRLPGWANNLIREGSSRQSSLVLPSPSPITDLSNQARPSQALPSSTPAIHRSPQHAKSRPKNPFLSD